jgi:hypothetical protein
VVYSTTVEEHWSHVREVLRRLQNAGFNLKPEVTFGTTEIKYLGHLISPRGISVLPFRVETIKRYPRPFNLRFLRRFLGMDGFYGRFIPSFSKIAAPLHWLMRKGVPFRWEVELQAAFDALKQALCDAPILQAPDFTKEFVLVTEGSDEAVSAVLHQRLRGDLDPISYYSRLLAPVENKYSTCEREC